MQPLIYLIGCNGDSHVHFVAFGIVDGELAGVNVVFIVTRGS
jgi:hypothetical protein